LALDAKPEVDVTFVSGEQIAEGALDHADALIIPGGVQKKMWSAANPLIERFKAQGYPVCTSCKDINTEN
jgi:putative intracellular protease/amidase